MMSARSWASSISTWKPSSFERRTSAKLNADGISGFPSSDYSGRSGHRWRPALGIVFPGDQQPAQQLSDGRFRDRIDEHKSSRTLEVREPGVATERIEVGFADKYAAL